MITSYFKPKRRPADAAAAGEGDASSSTSAAGKRRGGATDADDTAESSSGSSSAGTASVASAKRVKTAAASAAAGPTDGSAAVAVLLSHLNDAGWREGLAPLFETKRFAELAAFVAAERRRHTVFPSAPETFAALNLCPLDRVRVVIVGQDPYHGPNQAHGLAFSVQRGQKVPPSLRNIYKELLQDGLLPAMPAHGLLTRWARQGVLLLNAALTVRSQQPNSHAGAGWHWLTDGIIRCVANSGGRDTGDSSSGKRRKLVFLLWGQPAQQKAAAAAVGHVVICTSHPSPLGATKTASPFLGSRCFSRCNRALEEMGEPPIDWNVDGPLP